MGSFGAGLASIGGSVAQAEELQRQQKIQEIKMALDKARVTTEQTYAQTRQAELDLERERLGVEKAREKRLGGPSVQQWKIVGNSMIAAGQNADGTPFVKSIPLDREVASELQGLNAEIDGAPLPEPIKQSLRTRLSSGLVEGDITAAAKDIRSVISSVSKQLGAPGSMTTGTEKMPIYMGPERGVEWWDVPIQRYNQKIPSGYTPSPLPGGSEPAGGGESGLPGIPQAAASGATDRPGAKQQPGLPAVPGQTMARPSTPVLNPPPGSRRIGAAPPSKVGANAGKLKPEMEAGLRVLHVSLFGTSSVPGLDSTVGVLDSKLSRSKLIAAGVGSNPNPDQWTLTKLAHAGFYSSMSQEEKAYVYQLNRAISAINALRSITGLPRSTQQLMDRYAQELPNPIVTPSSKDAKDQLKLIEREIAAALDDATKITSPGGGAGLPGSGDSNPLGLNIK